MLVGILYYVCTDLFFCSKLVQLFKFFVLVFRGSWICRITLFLSELVKREVWHDVHASVKNLVLRRRHIKFYVECNLIEIDKMYLHTANWSKHLRKMFVWQMFASAIINIFLKLPRRSLLSVKVDRWVYQKIPTMGPLPENV